MKQPRLIELNDRPVARTIAGFCQAYGIGHSTTYELIAAGVLVTVKAGRRTLILEESARQWLQSLPTNVCKPKITDCDEYETWLGMRQRCTNPNHPDYRLYGARGIVVCEKWDEFLVFLADMGPRPSPKHSIDRLNNEGNYEPKNCRWATPKQQRKNQRRGKKAQTNVHTNV